MNCAASVFIAFDANGEGVLQTMSKSRSFMVKILIKYFMKIFRCVSPGSIKMPQHSFAHNSKADRLKISINACNYFRVQNATLGISIFIAIFGISSPIGNFRQLHMQIVLIHFILSISSPTNMIESTMLLCCINMY